jgi:cytochrome c oxidase subunit 2
MRCHRGNPLCPTQEIAAVITYTRNSWSNKAAENIVQPAEVLAARK